MYFIFQVLCKAFTYSAVFLSLHCRSKIRMIILRQGLTTQLYSPSWPGTLCLVNQAGFQTYNPPTSASRIWYYRYGSSHLARITISVFQVMNGGKAMLIAFFKVPWLTRLEVRIPVLYHLLLYWQSFSLVLIAISPPPLLFFFLS